MGNTPWYVGDGKPWTYQLTDDASAFDVTGLSTSDFTLKFLDINNNNTPRTGTGTFSNLTAASGQFGATNYVPAAITYTPASGDVTTTGIYEIRIIVKSGTTAQQTLSQGRWQCIA